MQIIIREAQTTDAAALIEHVRQIAAEPDIDVPLQAEEFTMTVAEEEQIIQEIADSDNSLFLVAEHRGQIVGHLSCRGGKRQAMRHATELGISIQRSWRGQGIGGQLMEAAIAWAKPSTIVKRIELKGVRAQQGGYSSL